MHYQKNVEVMLIKLLREQGGRLTVDARTQDTYAVHLDRMASEGKIQCVENGYPRSTYRLHDHQLRFQRDMPVVWERAGQSIPATVVRTSPKRVQILFRTKRGLVKLRWIAPDELRLADSR